MLISVQSIRTRKESTKRVSGSSIPYFARCNMIQESGEIVVICKVKVSPKIKRIVARKLKDGRCLNCSADCRDSEGKIVMTRGQCRKCYQRFLLNIRSMSRARALKYEADLRNEGSILGLQEVRSFKHESSIDRLAKG